MRLRVLIQTLAVHFLFITVAYAGAYYEQNQHNAFFFYGNNGESLTTDCYLEKDLPKNENLIPELEGFCNFSFDIKSSGYTHYRVRFEHLKEIQPKLLQDLDVYAQSVLQGKQPNILERIFLFRDQDHEALADFVLQLKDEPLPYKVLLRKDFQSNDQTPQFFDRKIVDHLMKIFRENIEPYALN